MDDRQDKLAAMETILDSPDIELMKVHSGFEALELVTKYEFAVILLDVRMPEMDGFQTAALIREQPGARTTPIIFVSAEEDETLLRKGYALGAVDYIRKIVPEILRAKVSVFVDLYRKTTDLTERERVERQLQAQYTVTRLLSEATRPRQVLEEVLETVGESFGWAWCAWWGRQGHLLRCTAMWNDPSCPSSMLAGLSKALAFTDEGLPGYVATKREAVWVEDIRHDPTLRRAAVAEEGWRSAVAFPVTHAGELLGVLECFSPHVRPRDEIMLATLKMIVSHIGQAFAINRIKARMRAIFEASLDCIITFDEEERILEWNPAAERVFGYSRKDALGARLTELIIPERVREEHRSSLSHLVSTNCCKLFGKRVEQAAVRSDGSEFPAEFAVTQIESDGPPLFTAYVRDITERRKAEQQLHDVAANLAESNADLAQFAYVASHDLQEPLRAVAGCVHLLEESYGKQLDDTARQLITHAVDGVRRMHTLIEDLLTYSRVGTEGKPFQEADCSKILKGVLANLATVIRERDAVVTYDNLPTVMADATQMAQLFQNLISNGIKFSTDRRPEIHIGARRQEGEWLFSVRDNGIGIDPRFADRVFLIFQRLHTRNEFPGSGIGLAICKRIVERHRGRIWVESEPGKGATFYFTIPDHTP